MYVFTENSKRQSVCDDKPCQQGVIGIATVKSTYSLVDSLLALGRRYAERADPDLTNDAAVARDCSSVVVSEDLETRRTIASTTHCSIAGIERLKAIASIST